MTSSRKPWSWKQCVYYIEGRYALLLLSRDQSYNNIITIINAVAEAANLGAGDIPTEKTREPHSVGVRNWTQYNTREVISCRDDDFFIFYIFCLF